MNFYQLYGFHPIKTNIIEDISQCTHQVTKIGQRVPSHLHDALRETAVVADEAGEDGGQAVAGSVQHNCSGGSLYLGAAAPCWATGK